MKARKYLYIVLGCLGLALGAVGAVLPFLPTVPFLMVAAVCFAKGSTRLDAWFKGTKLYKENLEDYVAGKGMTKKTKIKIMVSVTILMSIGFAIMGAKGAIAGCIVLCCIWILHIFYFCFGVKTIIE